MYYKLFGYISSLFEWSLLLVFCILLNPIYVLRHSCVYAWVAWLATFIAERNCRTSKNYWNLCLPNYIKYERMNILPIPSCNHRDSTRIIKGPPEMERFYVRNAQYYDSDTEMLTWIALASIHPAFTVACTKKIVGNWLIVSPITVFISPNWKLCFSLDSWFFATIVRRSPSYYARSPTLIQMVCIL